MRVDVPCDAVVVRFRPISSEALLRSAGEYRRLERHRLSVFADAARQGESTEAVEARLLLVAFGKLDPRAQ